MEKHRMTLPRKSLICHDLTMRKTRFMKFNSHVESDCKIRRDCREIELYEIKSKAK